MNINTDAIRRLRDSLLAHDGRQAGRSGDDAAPLPAAQTEAFLQRVTPFAETMYLVMMADGESAAAERKALIAALQVLTDGQLGTAELDALIDRFATTAAHEGPVARLQHIGAHLAGDRQDRETAFTLAAVIALADERVDIGENRLLASVQEYYGISDRRTAALLEALD